MDTHQNLLPVKSKDIRRATRKRRSPEAIVPMDLEPVMH